MCALKQQEFNKAELFVPSYKDPCVERVHIQYNFSTFDMQLVYFINFISSYKNSFHVFKLSSRTNEGKQRRPEFEKLLQINNQSRDSSTRW